MDIVTFIQSNKQGHNSLGRSKTPRGLAGDALNFSRSNYRTEGPFVRKLLGIAGHIVFRDSGEMISGC